MLISHLPQDSATLRAHAPEHLRGWSTADVLAAVTADRLGQMLYLYQLVHVKESARGRVSEPKPLAPNGTKQPPNVVKLRRASDLGRVMAGYDNVIRGR